MYFIINQESNAFLIKPRFLVTKYETKFLKKYDTQNILSNTGISTILIYYYIYSWQIHKELT